MELGRPKKTLKDLPEDWRDRLIELGRAGKSQEYMAASMGIGKELFYRFKAEEQDFSNAVSEAIGYSRMFWEDAGIEGMYMGGKDNPFNATVWTFNMKNRFAWADKQEVDHTTKGDKVQSISPHQFIGED